jgi:NAD(P)-dependent dehydrogenase (short-subunit alcohol dehydrogenase family)
MNIVITGSTRGIGLGLAREFLSRGHSVMVSGRHEEAVRQTVAGLSDAFPANKIHGHACDVDREAEVEALWNEAARVFESVDIWINNAGRNNPKQRLHMMELAEFEGTLHTNLMGMINGSVIALRGMLKQGSGWIFNMEGFGSEGMIGIDQVPYGLSKYGLRYFTKALVKTMKGSPVKVGYLSPGIVTTEMAVPRRENRGEFFDNNKKFLNIMADHVETVTPWLVEKILKACARPNGNGIAIRWMSLPRAAGRLIGSLFRKRRVIEEAMERLDSEKQHRG